MHVVPLFYLLGGSWDTYFRDKKGHLSSLIMGWRAASFDEAFVQDAQNVHTSYATKLSISILVIIFPLSLVTLILLPSSLKHYFLRLNFYKTPLL